MNVALGRLENELGHKFTDIKLLERAMTHRSWAHENIAGNDEAARLIENESLEFLGDSVLGLIIAELLFTKHPTLGEGGLTLMKHRLVSAATLSDIGERLGLGNQLRMGRGEEKTGGRRKHALLADATEAVIGAIFIDGGYPAARAFVRRVFAEELRNASPEGSLDYKTMLQELLQGMKQVAPAYTLVSTEGPPHERRFYVEAKWQDGISNGEGTSIKLAEMAAAKAALDMLRGDQGRTAVK
jgi:ribonuclease III